jgi:hypothetical protein
MKSPLIPYGAGKGDKPRPVDKRTYDANYEAIFRSKDRREDQGSTPPQLPGGGEEASTQDAVAAGANGSLYNRQLGPDGATWFVVGAGR